MNAASDSNGSLWLEGVEERRFPGLEVDRTCDVAIVGGGIVGVLAAERLAQAGAKVIVVEAAQIGRGVTGNTTGKLSALQQNAYSKIRDTKRGELYPQANLDGLAAVSKLVESEEIECDFERREAIVFAENEKQGSDVDSEFTAATNAGLPVDRSRNSMLPIDSWGAIHLAGQAQFNAARFTIGLAERLADRGAVEFFEQSRVRELSERGSGACVDTLRGSVRAQRVLIASHYPFADRGLFFSRLEPKRSYCIAFELAGEAPAGMFISAGEPTHSIRTAPSPDGKSTLLIVGGAGHRVGEGEPTRSYSSLEAWTRDHFEVGAVTHSWSAQDDMTRDHLPNVGRLHPASSSVLVATGFNKWGLAAAGAAAAEVERLCAGAVGPHSEIFDPWSGVSVRGIATIAEAGAKFAGHLVKGELRERSAPVCTHMGCRLKWNDAEDSWDCPCHGSRFAADGHVLEGPATRDLDL